MKKAVLAGMIAGLVSKHKVMKVPSRMVVEPRVTEQISKRKMQRIKGKKARKNRGRNRREN